MENNKKAYNAMNINNMLLISDIYINNALSINEIERHKKAMEHIQEESTQTLLNELQFTIINLNFLIKNTKKTIDELQRDNTDLKNYIQEIQGSLNDQRQRSIKAWKELTE